MTLTTLALLQQNLYNFASTFGLDKPVVNTLAQELGYPAFTREAYRPLRQEIEKRYGGNHGKEEKPQRKGCFNRGEPPNE